MSLLPFSDFKELDQGILLPLYREYAWDYEANDLILDNGNPTIVEGNDAIRVWCYKALLTPRYVHPIYSGNYGSELNALLGKAYSRDLTESEAGRYIKEALEINPYIMDVNVTSSRLVGDRFEIECYVKTIYGEVIVNV